MPPATSLTTRMVADEASVSPLENRHARWPLVHRKEPLDMAPDVRTLTRSITAGLCVASLTMLSAQTPPAGGQRGTGAGRGPATPPLILTSSAWEDGGVLPDKYTQASGPTAPSPELKWSQVPPGTQSFALLMHDPE